MPVLVLVHPTDGFTSVLVLFYEPLSTSSCSCITWLKTNLVSHMLRQHFLGKIHSNW